MLTPDIEVRPRARLQPRTPLAHAAGAVTGREPETSFRSVVPRDLPPWYQRAGTMTALTVLVLVVVCLAIPPLRQQLLLSVTRQPTPYVELYFTKPTATGTAAVCSRGRGMARVSFAMRSHLRDTDSIPWRVSFRVDRSGVRTVQRRGTARLSPDQVRHVRTTAPMPRGSHYVVRVWLPGQGEQLRVHCPGRTS